MLNLMMTAQAITVFSYFTAVTMLVLAAVELSQE